MPDSSASPSRDFQIYLSSTLDDLVDERKAAIEILRKHGRVIDSYQAGPQPTVENCLADVRSSQLYVLIQGRRYGWVPAGESDTDARSITEMEYDRAAKRGIPRLIFLIDEEHSCYSTQAAGRAQLRNGHVLSQPWSGS